MERLRRASAALGLRWPKDGRRRLLLISSLLAAGACLPVGPVYAATLTSASVSLSDPRPTNTASYTFTASGVTFTGVECIQAVFSTTDGGFTAPPGLSTTSATLDMSATNYVPTPSGFTLNNATNGTLTLTDSTAQTPAQASNRVLQLDNITNSSQANTTFYLAVSTYANTACTTPVDTATVVFMNSSGATLSISVNPTLSFSVAGVGSSQSCDGTTTTAASTSSTLPFGLVTAATNAFLCQELSAATNATNGYTIYLRYTNKPTSADSETINDAPGSNTSPAAFPSPGTEAYGYTTSASNLSTCGGSCSADRFTDGSTYHYYAAATTTNAEVGYNAAGDSGTNYYIGHQVGVSAATGAGTYTTTIIYTCAPVY